MKYRLLMLAAVFFAASCMITLKHDLIEETSREFQMTSGSELSFQNANGDIEVREWESDYIQIKTLIYGDSARGVPENLNIRFDESENRLSAVVDYPDGISLCSVNFVVNIPAQMEYIVSCATTNGETLISADVTANAESVNGDISVEALSSDRLITVNGDISARLSQQSLSLVIETTNGDVSVELPPMISVDAETVNGEVFVQDSEAPDQILAYGSAVVRIETSNGDIQVMRIPQP